MRLANFSKNFLFSRKNFSSFCSRVLSCINIVIPAKYLKLLPVVMALLIIPMASAIPNVINIQGKLTDAQYNAQSGTHNFTFTIYNALTGGTARYSENISLNMSQGLWSHQLGSNNTIALGFAEDYYIEIIADGQTLAPRLRLSSVGFAYKANISDNVSANSYALGNFTIIGNVTIQGNGTFNGSTICTENNGVCPKNVSLNYGWNGTIWSPLLTTGDGTLRLAVYQSGTNNVTDGGNATGNFTVGNNLIVNRNLTVGTTNLFVDNANARVGIGTTGPDTPLEIEGSEPTIHVDASTHAKINLDRGSTNYESVLNLQTAGTTKWRVGLTNDGVNDDFRIYSDVLGAAVIYAKPSGNVGINTTTPSGLLQVNVNGSNIFYVNETGRITVYGPGATSPVAALIPGGVHSLVANDGSGTRLGLGASSTAGNPGGYYRSVRARGTLASPSVVQSGDALAIFAAEGYDGSSRVPAAQINLEVDGTPGASDMPGRITFSTTADQGSSVTERARITNAGFLGINTTTPSGLLQVNANGSDVFHINETGNIGIGTTAPGSLVGSGQATLELAATLNPEIKLNRTTTNPASASLRITDFGALSFAVKNGTSTLISNAVVISTGNGYVGIGTTSPGALLHVANTTSTATAIIQGYVGNVTLSQSSSTLQASVAINGYEHPSYTGGSKLIIGTNDLILGNTNAVQGTGNYNSTIQLSTESNFEILAGNSSRMYFSNAGKVGIGTTGPNYILETNSSDGIVRFIRNQNTAGNDAAFIALAALDSDNAIQNYAGIRSHKVVNTAGSEDGFLELQTIQSGTMTSVMHLDENGNVGINTSTPETTLHVVRGESESATLFEVARFVVNDTTQGSLRGLSIMAPTRAISAWGLKPSGTSTNFVIQNSTGTSNFVLTDTGSVGIGTASPNHALHVFGNVSTTQRVLENTSIYKGVSTDGLVTLYTFDDGSTALVDHSGYGHSAVGNEPALLNRSGKFGSALTFNGIDNRYEIDDAARNLEFATSNFSVEMWVFMNNNTAQQGLVIKNAGSVGWHFRQQGGNPLCRISNQTQASIDSNAGSGLSDGKWAHFACVVDRTAGTISSYVNGVLMNTTAIPSGFGAINSTGQLTLGQGGAGWLNGTIDSVAIYNRSLTIDEVVSHYQRWTELVDNTGNEVVPGLLNVTGNGTHSAIFSGGHINVSGGSIELDSSNRSIRTIGGLNLDLDYSGGPDTDDDFAIRLAGNTAFFIDGTNPFTGNVGIGTAGPAKKLDLRVATGDGLAITHASVAHGMTDELPTNAYGFLRDANGNDGGLLLFGASDVAGTTGLNLMGFIGSSDPTDTVPAMLFEASKANGTTRQVLGAAETAFQFKTFSTNLVTILGNGNVGIGTTTPTSPESVVRFLHIRGTNAGIVLDDSDAATSVWDIWSSGGTLNFARNNDATTQIQVSSAGGVALPQSLKVGTTLASDAYYEGADDGLVGYYPFSDGSGTTSTDKSRTGGNATFADSPYWNESGKLGRAISLNGFSQYANISIGTQTNVSFSAWINPNDNTPGGEGIGNLVGGGGIYQYLSINTQFRTYNGTAWIAGTSTLANNQWAHVAMTFNGGNKSLKLYVNGVLESSTASSSYTDGSPTKIGVYSSAASTAHWTRCGSTTGY